MYALVDCNNFYASCERLFQPALIGKPVIVLSNNDGCVIARSNEAKLLGIRMGAPAFEIKDVILKNNVAVFSSNYVLYGDISRRVMNTLSQFAPEIEIYSIDEAFLNLSGFDIYDIEAYARKIVYTTTKNIGIPVSVGIAPTKTLAKVANKIAKKNQDKKGVFILNDKTSINKALEEFSVSDVWGIGRQYSKFLNKYNIFTALDFVNTNKEWIRKNMSIVGVRTMEELQGNPCIEMETTPPDKKAICTSRSFGTMQSEYEPIAEAVAQFAATCAAKLRKQKSCAAMMIVFIHTNQFRKDLKQYAKNIVVSLPVASNSSMELIKYAEIGLKAIYKKGFQYKKAGVIVSDIISENNLQTSLFDEVNRDNQKKVMQVLDKLNSKMGRDKVRIAQQGFSRKWKLRQEKLSPCYTTNINDILIVKT
ncbi:MAG: SOS mutagenesis and repair protein UmuC [Bacteroidetes bacterium CG2_30_32_10]|nr:MAG: SOS mutagenesis and repair protein UmuC [Bacteroidetes bacterium CG2_30_32_10]